MGMTAVSEKSINSYSSIAEGQRGKKTTKQKKKQTVGQHKEGGKKQTIPNHSGIHLTRRGKGKGGMKKGSSSNDRLKKSLERHQEARPNRWREDQRSSLKRNPDLHEKTTPRTKDR